MLQSKARLLELNAKLANTLTSKGVTANADETTTSLINKVSDISSGGDDSILASLIDRSIKSVVIPDSTTRIGIYAFDNCRSLTSVTIPNSVTSIDNNAFQYCTSLTSITIPDSVTSIGTNAFNNCTSLTSITIPDSVTSIGTYAFSDCTSLTSVTIPDSVTHIGGYAFNKCTSLTSVTIPNSIKSISTYAFSSCSSLENVTLGDDFNVNNLNLSSSNLYTRETILQWLNALADRTGQTAYKLTIGATNLKKLTEEDIAIATAKNWTLS